MAPREQSHDEPIYVIGVAARLVQMHPQSLRYYERIGLVVPSRSRGNLRLYSQRDVDRLLRVQQLVNDLGVNLAGVEVILKLIEQLADRERDITQRQYQLETEIARLRALLDHYSALE